MVADLSRRASDTSQWEQSRISKSEPLTRCEPPDSLEGSLPTVPPCRPEPEAHESDHERASNTSPIDLGPEPLTVRPVTPTAPPIQARAGQRRAREDIVPRMPIRTAAPPPPAATNTPSPLGALRFPVALASPLAMVPRRLDGARLCAPDLVALVGWTPGLALEVDNGRAHRLRLRARAEHVRPVVGTKRGHIDNTGRLVLTADLRTHLGLGEGDPVIVWAERDAHGAPSGIVAIANAALCAREDAGAPVRLRTVV